MVYPGLFRNSSKYSWSASEVDEAEGASLLFAADVIYSDELTDAFFNIVEKLMSHGSEKVMPQISSNGILINNQ